MLSVVAVDLCCHDLQLQQKLTVCVVRSTTVVVTQICVVMSSVVVVDLCCHVFCCSCRSVISCQLL